MGQKRPPMGRVDRSEPYFFLPSDFRLLSQSPDKICQKTNEMNKS